MLFKEIDKLVSKIKMIEPVKDCNLFLESMTLNNAKVLKNISRSHEGERLEVQNLISLSSGCIRRLIVPLPDIIGRILTVIKSSETEPHIRCALVGTLAYFVQPNDLIPDDAKGGYGFVDDSVLIHAAFSELLYTKGEMEGLNHLKNLSVLAASVCPPGILKPLAAAIKDITAGFFVYAKLPPEILDAKTNKVIMDPFQPISYKSVPEIKHKAVASWSPFVNVNNAKKTTLEYKSGQFEANFVDGTKLVVK